MTIRTNTKWARVTRSYDEFFKFEQPGDGLEGVWLGVIQGKYATGLGRVRTDDGLVIAFSLIAALQELEGIPTDTEVKIVFTGSEPTKAGFDLERFEPYNAGRIETASALVPDRESVAPSMAGPDSSAHEDEES